MQLVFDFDDLQMELPFEETTVTPRPIDQYLADDDQA